MSGAIFHPELVDADDRHAAVTVLDRPILVEAGAGTGKTRLLVDRIVHAVETGAVRLARVTAISFTEKAAAELRLRIRQTLERRRGQEGIDARAAERLGQALHELDRARISTIHAFAAGLIREQPIQARIDPRFRTLDELESARFFREIWDRWVDGELAEAKAAPRLREVLMAGVRLEPDLFVLARALDQQRDVVADLAIPARATDLEARLQAVRDDMRRCIAHADEHCRDPADGGLRALHLLGRALEPLDDLELASWPAVFLALQGPNVAAGRKDAWAPGENEASKTWRRRLKGELEAVHQSIADTVLHSALRWLEGFRTTYTAEKRRQGVLDFQDLLIEARDLVRLHPGVRRDLAARIDMLCVDEFQDTDPLQAELVLFLAEVDGPAAAWDQVRIGPKLFLVGDPKQSIYRFRRADLDIYARCAERIEASGGRRLRVRQNFRSRPAVIDWVNATFEPLLGVRPVAAGDAAPEGPGYVPLAATVPAGVGPAVWILRPTSGPEPAELADWRAAEAAALVDWIRQALARPLLVRGPAGERPLAPGDIAMLFARTSGIEIYEAALRDAGLPFQQEGGRLFFRRQEVRDVLHALAAIDDPQDDLSIVAALRSPLFGATDEELLLHRATRPSFSYLEPAGDLALAARLEILAALHAERHTRGVAGTIHALLDRTEARAVLAARPLGSQALANVEMLERLAAQFESTRPAGLREFVRSLRDVDEDAPRIAEWTPQEETTDRIRMLSVHVAKGLEFPCVLLANLASQPNRRGEPVLVDRDAHVVETRLEASDVDEVLRSPGYRTVAEVEKLRDQAEERRLLYVAATRAEDHLVVPRFHGKRASGLLEHLLAVGGAFGETGEPFGALPATASEPRADAPWCFIEPQAASAARRSAASRGAVARPDLHALWARRAGWEARQAARLARGAANRRPDDTTELGAGGVEGKQDDARFRVVLARVLERTLLPRRAADATHVPEDSAAILRHMVALTGTLDLARPLAVAVERLRTSDIGARVARAARAWSGLRVTVDAGAARDVWLDLAFDAGDGLVIVEILPAGGEAERVAASRRALAQKAEMLRAAGLDVREVLLCDLDPGRAEA